MEIGFNAGHSAETFPEANKTMRLYSFDIGIYPYVYQGKKFLDTK